MSVLRCYFCSGERGVKSTCIECNGAAREKITARDLYRAAALIGVMIGAGFQHRETQEQVVDSAMYYGDAAYDRKTGEEP